MVSGSIYRGRPTTTRQRVDINETICLKSKGIAVRNYVTYKNKHRIKLYTNIIKKNYKHLFLVISHQSSSVEFLYIFCPYITERGLRMFARVLRTKTLYPEWILN